MSLICCIAVYTFATTGIVKTDNLRLRKEDSTSSEILTLLSLDDKVEVISKTDNGWYKVKYKEYEGYVSGEYLNVQDEKIEIAKNEETETISEQENITETETTNNTTISQEETPAEVKTGILKKDDKIYGIPLINANTIIVIDKDTQVNVLMAINGWCYISAKNIEGWVRIEKIKSTTENEKQQEEQQEQQQIGYITANDVNMRKGPSTSEEILSKLTLNKEVIVLEKTNGWTKIEANDQIGYVSNTYISDKKVETTSRSSSSRRTQETNKQVESKQNSETTKINANGPAIVEYAKQYLGYKYVYGGTTPAGFDCSGFTQYVYKHFGYTLTRTSSSQASNGVSVNKSDLQLGDIICFSGSSGNKNVSHVGIYIGNGQFIHAANSRKGVIISNVDGAGFFYVCARRIV